MPKNIKVAIAGVGNCASALVQGVEYYRSRRNAALNGVMHQPRRLPGQRRRVRLRVRRRQRKVGRPLEEAIFAKPNNTRVFQSSLPVSNVVVQMGPELDGVAPHMADYDDDVAFRPADLEPTNIAEALRRSGAEVLLCYLPVGSEKAVKHYAEACLAAGVAMVNCVPVFLASDPEWAKKFQDAGLPIVGDDIKSQVGATIVHRSLARLFADRGVALDRTYQLNTAGNTDFLNMLERKRLKSKKLSKTESVQSQLDERLDDADIHIGPSDYIPWQHDNKIAFIRLEGRGFGDAPLEIELRLSVQDSSNSAGVVIDALRCAKLGLDRGIGGPLEAPSAYFMKTPPRQFRDSVAYDACNAFIDGEPFDFPRRRRRARKLRVAAARKCKRSKRCCLILAARSIPTGWRGRSVSTLSIGRRTGPFADAFAPAFYAADDALVGALAPTTGLKETVDALTTNFEAELARRGGGTGQRERWRSRPARSFALPVRNVRRLCPQSPGPGDAEPALSARRGVELLRQSRSGLRELGSWLLYSGSWRIVSAWARRSPTRRFSRPLSTALQARPETTVMVGDSLRRDYEGARRSGMGFIWIAPEDVQAAERDGAKSVRSRLCD